MNKYPIRPGHVMVLPVRHVESVEDLTKEERSSVMETAERLAGVLRELYGRDSLIFANTGKFRSKPEHYHMHVLPMEKATRLILTEYVNQSLYEEISEDEMKETAQKVKHKFFDGK